MTPLTRAQVEAIGTRPGRGIDQFVPLTVAERDALVKLSLTATRPAPQRAECPTCGKFVAVTKDGRLRVHHGGRYCLNPQLTDPVVLR